MKAARQLTAVSMTWGEWKTKADAEDFANAKAMNLSDDSEMISTKRKHHSEQLFITLSGSQQNKLE